MHLLPGVRCHHIPAGKLTHAKVGDFIVTAQEGNYSLLCVRSIAEETLILEEISVPCKQIDMKAVEWKK